ncbi:protein kinase [Actinoallomurus spadix]|uniref:Protein kinase domain-containing protein n=1 Tax=Actinoallomurus spadix TaxID=79912 RepID=A0ABP3H6B9_9ACTN|nr:serine/threonine-protein kinase [Actinoallomurus spadix]MCO5988946.1 protein kinase [Actinoallomurus spadix]
MSADDRIGPLPTTDPAELGPYRLLGVIGHGGMGTVYLAESASGERVAVKVINVDFAQDPTFRHRFRREVEAARRVRRFCTAPVIDARTDEEPLYIVTEYLAGPDLAAFVRESGPLRGASLDHLAVGVATALGAIHGAGIVHRDLKPANVLLAPMGPRVIDFGIARALDSVTEATRPGQLVGTPAYMAPEVIQGKRATTASDIFAWGAVVAFAGTGGTPFSGGELPAVLYRIMHEEPSLDGLDEAVRPLVERALDKDPARRPSARELLSGLTGHVRADPARPPADRVPPSGDAARSSGDAGAGDRSAGRLPELSSGRPSTGPAATAPRPEQATGQASPGAAADPGATLLATGAPAGTEPAGPAREGDEGRHRLRTRRIAWIAAATAGAAVAIGAVVALMPFGGATRTVPVYTSSFLPDAPTWDRDRYTSYVAGRYRMTAEGRADNDSKPAPYPSQDLPSRLEADVDAAVVAGPGDGAMGLGCRGPDYRILDGYVFLVRPDGHEAFIREVTRAGSWTLAMVPRVRGYRDTVAGGGSPSTNHLMIQCEPQGAKVRLRLWVNGRLTAEAMDGQDPLAVGQTGLVVMRGSGAHGGQTVVDFDDYRISRLEGGD